MTTKKRVLVTGEKLYDPASPYHAAAVAV